MSWGFPWAISGTDVIPMDVARQVVYDAAGGHEGPIKGKDCQVLATAVASDQVRVMPGSVIVLGRASGQFNEAYSCRNTGTDLSPAITATGSGGGRTDLVYAHVTDPDQPGNPSTAVEVETRVIEGVLSTTETLQDAKDQGLVGDDVSGVALARITRPASTGIVTQAQITDLRDLGGTPRRFDLQRIFNQTDTAENPLTETSFVVWPLAATWQVRIPKWAVRAQVMCNIGGYRLHEGGSGGGANVVGEFRVKLGTNVSNPTMYNQSSAAGNGTVDAAASFNGGDFYIDASERGTTVELAFQGKKNSGDGWLSTGRGTVVGFTVVFYEAPDEQGWEA